MKQERINEIIGFLFLACGLFCLWSLLTFSPADTAFFTSHPNSSIQNGAGIIGSYLSFGLIFSFGVSAYIFPLIAFFWALSFLLQRMPEKLFFKVVGFIVFQSSTSALFTLLSAPDAKFDRGGIWGFFLGSNLETYFGFGGGMIISCACFVLSFILATEFLVFPYLMQGVSLLGNGIVFLFSSIKERIASLFEKTEEEEVVKPKSKKAKKAKKKTKATKSRKKKVVEEEPEEEYDYVEEEVEYEEEEPEEEYEEDEEPEEERSRIEEFFENIPELKVTKYDPKALEEKIRAQNEASADAEEKKKPKRRKIKLPKGGSVSEEPDDSVVFSAEAEEGEEQAPYEFPPFEMLQEPEAVKIDDDLTENSKILQDCLKTFNIEVRVTEVEQGPVITRYEILPAPGIKVSRITSLQDDIALAMKAPSLRIIAPIPGKSAVGIEVPNSTVNKVYLRELLQFATQKKKIQLPLVLGKDTSGKVLVGDLAEMPHMLIAGSTGSGKTVCINTLIVSLFYCLSPDELKFIMVDPKRVELACYNDIPYLLAPVVTNPKKASATLNWVVNEMDNRYKLFAKIGVRNLQAYNTRKLEDDPMEEGETMEDVRKKYPTKLPYIVVIVDELADLMMVAADKVETAIARLAQLARATGIHLILATQRPSVDVITGVIKSNFPARVSFKVSSKTDSRTVLDCNGAEGLLGKGDMLFLKPGRDKPIRAQGALISDGEINNIVEFIKEQKEVEYNQSVQDASEGKSAAPGQTDRDELFDECVRIVLEANQASVSLLQRRLRIGYTRAARIVDQLEHAGIIGPYQGSKPREILVTQAEEEEAEV